MDAIISYVNNQDIEWQKELSLYRNEDVNSKRYRDYGLLKYLLRGIDKFMPFVDRVFLIVARQSQIPNWVSNKLNIVLHKDYIPNEFLPTFNSSTIEAFLPLIKNLSEEFIYFNDDMFPISVGGKDNFFINHKPVIRTQKLGFAFTDISSMVHEQHVLNIHHLLNIHNSISLFHSPSPLLKSKCLKCYHEFKNAIHDSITQFRQLKNLNYYLYSLYNLSYGIEETECITKYISISDLYNFLKTTSLKQFPFICLNDDKDNIVLHMNFIKQRFQMILPEKSKYEA